MSPPKRMFQDPIRNIADQGHFAVSTPTFWQPPPRKGQGGGGAIGRKGRGRKIKTGLRGGSEASDSGAVTSECGD